MGWTLVSRSKADHRCDFPQGDYAKVGDVIRCDCGQHWKLTMWPGDFREPASYSWKKCNEKGVES